MQQLKLNIFVTLENKKSFFLLFTLKKKKNPFLDLQTAFALPLSLCTLC